MNIEGKFFWTLLKLYKKARQPIFKRDGLTRAHAHSISSLAEDVFAKYLLDAHSSYIDNIVIDSFLSIKDGMRGFRPDIIVVKGGVVSNMFDVKTDMGFSRTFANGLLEKHTKSAERIAGKKLNVKQTDSVFGELKFSDRLRYDVVLLTNANSGVLEQLKDNPPDPNITSRSRYHVLSDGEHPIPLSCTVDEELRADPKKMLACLNIKTHEFEKIGQALKR